ncbi:MAG: hypothetical protein ACK4FV_03840 [Candidatus Nitrosocaldus sp.]
MGDSGTDGIDVKALLYSVIERLGRDSLRRGLVRDSRSIISLILSSCMKELSSSDRDGDATLRLVTALMHYLLTECMIPSERKIQLDDMMLDLVIPSMRVLRSNPDNTLIILISSDEVDALNQRLERVYALYPRVNLWTVVVGNVDVSKVGNTRVYMMDEYADNQRSLPFSSIIEDIRGFMYSKGIRPFNIIV